MSGLPSRVGTPEGTHRLRVDVLTIFPEYLAPLNLSLIGKAQRDGVLDLRVRDLREHAHDRHRTVDDTPYGGGAGMVMKPEPWAEALDTVMARPSPQDGVGVGRPRLIVPGPGGTPFTQATARRLAEEDWLVFACGRYEGIDERVYDHATEVLDGRVEVISLGDYVLNGGEVAVLAMIEAIARLIPGVVGNAESLVEESHENGLLEYPVYTKPASWRGRQVPDVLLSGDHARIARWRREQSVERTAARRPDLLSSSALGGWDDMQLRPAVPADAPELLVLQRCCWLREGRLAGTFDIPPLMEEADDVRLGITRWTTWVVRDPGGRLVGSVRGRAWSSAGPDTPADRWEIGRLMVAPDLQGRGLGRRLLAFAEQAAPPGIRLAHLITGAASAGNQRLYHKAGFRRARDGETSGEVPDGTVEFVKRLG